MYINLLYLDVIILLRNCFVQLSRRSWVFIGLSSYELSSTCSLQEKILNIKKIILTETLSLLKGKCWSVTLIWIYLKNEIVHVLPQLDRIISRVKFFRPKWCKSGAAMGGFFKKRQLKTLTSLWAALGFQRG